MKYSWKEYQDAKCIVNDFENTKKDIQHQRLERYLSFNCSSQDIIWFHREQLNVEMYALKNASQEQIDRIGADFWQSYINNQKAKLLELRFKVFREK